LDQFRITCRQGVYAVAILKSSRAAVAAGRRDIGPALGPAIQMEGARSGGKDASEVCVEQAGKAGPFGDRQGKGSAETNTAQPVTGVDDAGRIPQRWRPTTQCRSVTNRRNLGQSFQGPFEVFTARQVPCEHDGEDRRRECTDEVSERGGASLRWATRIFRPRPKSALGHSRRLGLVGDMSGLPQTGDISGPCRHFAFGPVADLRGRRSARLRVTPATN
jgi:hypothetical protein